MKHLPIASKWFPIFLWRKEPDKPSCSVGGIIQEVHQVSVERFEPDIPEKENVKHQWFLTNTSVYWISRVETDDIQGFARF